MNEFIYLIRRELWEHRALYIVPLVFAAIVVLSVTVGITRGTAYVGSDHIGQALQKLNGEDVGIALGVMSFAMWGLFSLVSAFMVAFYLLDSLYGDRKDRSVLFWKSLPISDTQTVLSKLAVATLVVPAIILAAALLTMFAVMLVMSIAFAFNGVNPLTMLWANYPLFTVLSKTLAIALVHAAWFLPLTGWLLLASASAKKTPFLLAALVPLGVILAEKLAFNTERFARMLGDYSDRFYTPLFSRVENFNVSAGSRGLTIDGHLAQIGDVSNVLTDPMLLIGASVGILFIVLAVMMRRRRIDIS